jgi:hypothetical protein
MKNPHALELDRRVATPPRSILTAALVVSVGILLGSCSKVNVTPLGSTSEGRRQFELTCNPRASENGSCHDKAIHACRGDYETLDVDNTGPRVDSYSGQIFTSPGHRVLLIACNR